MHTRTWKDYLLTDTAILVWMAVASVILHCLVNNQYGFHRDELNFIEDGRHLAWGYVDCPPFTPFVAHIAEMLFGTSLVGIRFFPAVSQGLVLVLTGLMVRRMGGNRWSQVIAAGGAAISGVSLSQGSIFMYVSFDFLWWVVVAYGVISLLKTGDARWITGERSRLHVHRMRNEVDAVLVGIGTVIADDPELPCRIASGRNPWRIVLDGKLRIPLSAKLLKNGNLKVYQKYPHGMCTTHAEVINSDLLSFIKA